MDVLPSNIVFDIFSRVPVKCLARSRCVSKVWCNYIDDRYLVIIHDKRVVEEPTPFLYHQHLSRERTTHSLCFHVIESIQTGSTHDYDLKPKEGPFLRIKPLSKSSLVTFQVRGSCNGVVCLSQDDNMVEVELVTALVAVHPLRKECYELPPLHMHFSSSMHRGSCGLGFDATTNTFKMICVLLKAYAPPNNHDMVRKKLCTMVHVFGTNSWREIPQVPSYPTAGKAIFANGCLHWLVSHIDIPTQDGRRPVIWFDVEKEEFGLIDPPKRMCDLWRNYSSFYNHLVDLNGEVGYVSYETLEVWLLKKKEWVPYCRLFIKQIIPYGYIEVLGCWNKEGDMLICNTGDGRYKFFVYNLKSGLVHKTNIVGPDDGCHPNIFMHPNKLFSIHGIGTNSFPMKKTNLKKSCQHLLSYK
ncbi:F-box domain-containing protein [Artemisia annua]|uniref:F-box domain-containing protein n=1 Tax=Artemisia annua TaxID=35608 RepID=A0A2U1QNQ3_ARTAN|nr:F-box domain-containing protein [Artemisia annua]